MNKQYFDLLNEGGEGYTQQPAEKDSRSKAELMMWLESDLRDAETDGLNYKATQLRAKIASLKTEI